VHTLELLKLRFGDISMRNCEVMIKDMDDSKRANANIHSTLEQSTTRQRTAKPVTDVAMVSHIFWPTLQQDPLKHHPRIQAELDEFSAEYARLKNPRKLVWLDQLGTVQIELDVVEDDPEGGEPVVETKEFTCTPLLATLISHFEDKQQWSVEDLSNETGVAEHILQKKMTYWVNNRVVRIVGQGSGGGPVYELATPSHLQEGGAYRDHHADAMMMDEDMGDQAVSVSAQEEEEIQVYESYIMGMLTNLQQLPLERIHNMLKMFCSSGSDNVKYNKTPQQLSAFLQHLCKQEKLECGPDGMYKLFKK
jgi:anaphase-promoting complex subunit 2